MILPIIIIRSSLKLVKKDKKRDLSLTKLPQAWLR